MEDSAEEGVCQVAELQLHEVIRHPDKTARCLACRRSLEPRVQDDADGGCGEEEEDDCGLRGGSPQRPPAVAAGATSRLGYRVRP